MKKLLLALTLTMATLTWVGCGDEGSACNDSSECLGAEACMWVKRNGQVVGKSCVLKCSDDATCAGTTCTGGATSCPSCSDFYRVCDAN